MIIFVVGTGTDVGKTHVTAALMKVAKHGGAWKPIASGVNDLMGDDARAIGADERPLYAFAPPISPHLAARRAGVTIRADVVAQKAAELADLYHWFFVESAGGLFSPISDEETNFDLSRALEKESARAPRRFRTDPHAFGVLLVAPDRIGVLHDIGATVRAAMIRPVVALSAPAVADASTGTNAEEIRRLRLASRVIEFPRATPDESQAAAAACLDALR
jgi:dethiobiotin synthetase